MVLCICVLFSASIPVRANETIEKNAKSPILRSPVYDIPAEQYFGRGWRMISNPVIKSKPYTPLTATEENIKDGLLYLLAPIYGGAVGFGVFISGCAARYVQTPDFEDISGIYSKTYYLAKPVKESDEAIHINVPVVCQVKKKTIFYEDSSMKSRYIIFSKSLGDINQLLPWYKYDDTSVGWY